MNDSKMVKLFAGFVLVCVLSGVVIRAPGTDGGLIFFMALVVWLLGYIAGEDI